MPVVEAAPWSSKTPRATRRADLGLAHKRASTPRASVSATCSPPGRSYKVSAANARTALAKAVRVYQEGAPRQSHEDLARDFIRASNAERAARVAGEPWAMKPEQRTRNGAAFVDVERAYSQGGDASAFARRMSRTGNRRGAYPKQSFGTVNRDPSRGAVPAPVVKQPIPALGK